MDFTEYQKLAMRTKPEGMEPFDALACGGLGIAGEAGEVADEVKKILFHHHVLDKDKVAKELGDVLWYIGLVADAIEVPMEEIARRNIEKLKARYPEGFDEERSRNRESSLTDDPNDPDLTRGVDKEPVAQAKKYLVLSEKERAKGFIRPVRRTYVHDTCASATTMSPVLAETYARDNKFYGATYCVGCQKHLPVAEFKWDDGSVVGS